jgi:cytochrome c
MKKTLMIAAAAAFIVGGAMVGTSSDAHAAVWGKCKACHNFTPVNKVGPGLGKGMLNGKEEPGDYMRVAGTHPGFHYEFAQYIPAGKAWHWDEDHLRQWMCNSKEAIKKFTGNPDARTRMPPQHVCDKADQDQVLAKLKEIAGYK